MAFSSLYDVKKIMGRFENTYGTFYIVLNSYIIFIKGDQPFRWVYLLNCLVGWKLTLV